MKTKQTANVFTLNSTTVVAKATFLPLQDYTPFARAIVAKFTTETNVDLDKLSEEINGYSQGKLTPKGRKVMVKYLFGAFNKQYPGLVDALQSMRSPQATSSAKSYDEY